MVFFTILRDFYGSTIIIYSIYNRHSIIELMVLILYIRSTDVQYCYSWNFGRVFLHSGKHYRDGYRAYHNVFTKNVIMIYIAVSD